MTPTINPAAKAVSDSAIGAPIPPQIADAIRALACLATDGALAEVLLCDIYADNPAEGIRIFWLLCGDSLHHSIDTIEHAAGQRYCS